MVAFTCAPLPETAAVARAASTSKKAPMSLRFKVALKYSLFSVMATLFRSFSRPCTRTGRAWSTVISPTATPFTVTPWAMTVEAGGTELGSPLWLVGSEPPWVGAV